MSAMSISLARFPQPLKRVIIKIGSSLLTKEKRIDPASIRRYASFIADLRLRGLEVALVSSGAVASAGDLREDPSLPTRQALASIGQVHLMDRYRRSFEKHKIRVAQVLLSEYLLKDRPSYLNASVTLKTLFKMGVLPIINENDAVSTEELQFGDNDVLGAIVAGLCQADLYIILSDVDGLFLDYGKPHARLLPVVDHISADLEKEAGGSRSSVGRGGMSSKLRAAKLALKFKVPTLISNGRKNKLFQTIFQEGAGTLFLTPGNALRGKKAWIASAINLSGQLILDSGAAEAIRQRGSSLLPSGVVDVKGHFHAGELCLLKNEAGVEIGKGISRYSSYEVEKIKGKKSSEITGILKIAKDRFHKEIIHRDELVTL
jgi:glutamate 5-kinase